MNSESNIYHQQIGHTETGPRFKVSSRAENRTCDPWIGGLARNN